MTICKICGKETDMPHHACMKTQTPETDAERPMNNFGGGFIEVVSADFARKLERERDEARLEAELSKSVTSIDQTIRQQEEIEQLKSDKDEIYEAAKAENLRCIEIAKERDQLRKVSDDLADVVLAAQECFEKGDLDSSALESYNQLPHVKQRNNEKI